MIPNTVTIHGCNGDGKIIRVPSLTSNQTRERFKIEVDGIEILLPMREFRFITILADKFIKRSAGSRKAYFDELSGYPNSMKDIWTLKRYIWQNSKLKTWAVALPGNDRSYRLEANKVFIHRKAVAALAPEFARLLLDNSQNNKDGTKKIYNETPIM